MRFCILRGSPRMSGNGSGITKWVNNQLQEALNSCSPNISLHNTTIIDPHTKPHPVNPVLEDTSPFQIKDSAYASQEVREWSQFIKSCSALIIVSPEYNEGYPSTLKNALDVLYAEWQHKPVAVVSYGARGGAKGEAQLRQVLAFLKMNIVEQRVQITLPKEYLYGNQRFVGSEYDETFLTQYKGSLQIALKQLLDKVLSQNETHKLY